MTTDLWRPSSLKLAEASGARPRLRGRAHAGRAATAIAVATAILVAAPVISIFSLALQPAPDVWHDLINYVLPAALLDTALLLVGVGALTLLIGAGTAWVISRHDFPGRGMLLWLMPLPLAIPTYLAAYVYADLFEPLGLVHRTLAIWLPLRDALGHLPNLRSLPGAIFVIGLVLYPYVYLSARATFQVQSAEFAEAARTLGAGRWTVFWRVSLPMARPALAVGVALVALETLNDIGASEYLGIRTLTVSIFTTWLNRGSLAGAAQLACLMLAIVAGLIAMERYGRLNANAEFSAESPHVRQRTTLSGARAWIAFAVCVLPVLIGFIVPLFYLAHQALGRGLLANFDPLLWRHTFHSFAYAALATLMALMLALATTIAHRFRPDPLRYVAMSIAQTGYALPGLVIALGLLTPVLAVDNALSAVAAWTGRSLPGLILVGSGTAVVIAYTIRFLAVPVGMIKAGFDSIPRDYDESARTVGAGQAVMLRQIYLPLLRPAMLGAVIIMFVDCLKELPATLLLRPLNVETLSTSIYQFASRGNFEDGALAALLIIAASIGPVVWLTRFSEVPSGPA